MSRALVSDLRNPSMIRDVEGLNRREPRELRHYSERMTAIFTIYGIMSSIAFATYLIDKRRAIRNEWRVPEATLHGLELFGGWPGAFIAQRVLRHKSRKTRYLLVFWGIGLIHALAWVWWFLSAK